VTPAERELLVHLSAVMLDAELVASLVRTRYPDAPVPLTAAVAVPLEHLRAWVVDAIGDPCVDECHTDLSNRLAEGAWEET